jgi:hypothetical protein
MNTYIENFSGGIRNKLNSVYNDLNTAKDMLDCDIDTGVLRSCKSIAYQAFSIQYPYKMLDEVYSIPYTADIVSSLNAVFILNEGQLTVSKNGVTHDIPAERPEVTVLLHNVTGDSDFYTVQELVNNKDIAIFSDLKLAITFYNEKTAYETKPTIEDITPHIPTFTGGLPGSSYDKTTWLNLKERNFIQSVSFDGTFTSNTIYGLTNSQRDAVIDFLHTFTGEKPISQRDDLYYTAKAKVPDTADLQDAIFHISSYLTNDVNEDFTESQRVDLYEYMYKQQMGLATNAMIYFIRWVPKRIRLTIHNPKDTSQGWHTRVYRQGSFRTLGVVTEFMLYTEFDTDSYILESDTDIGTILTTQNAIEALNPTYITSSNNVLFLADDNKLYFTDLGTMNINWNNYLLFDSTITGIEHARDFTIVTTANNSVYSVQGDTVASFKVLKLADDIDCINNKTMCAVDNAIVWLSSVGLVQTNGFSISPVHKYTISADTFPEGYWYASASVLTDYYLLIDHTIYKYDMQRNILTKYSANDSIVGMYLHKGHIYVYTRNAVGKLFSGIDTNFTYTTNSIALPKHYYMKMYGEVRLLYKGNILIEVYIDGYKTNTVQLPEADSPERAVFKINAIKDVGYSLYLTYTGTGTIYDTDITYNLGDTL